MLTIDEYIAKKKRADKLDEFDYSNQSENMAAVMKYAMSYFNEYLTMEACDNETIKMKHSMDKLEAEVEKKYPRSKQFILEFYSQHKFGIHKVVNNWLKNLKYFVFLYSEEDFSSAANDFCSTNNIKDVDVNKYYNDIKILISEIKGQDTEGPPRALLPWRCLHPVNRCGAGINFFLIIPQRLALINTLPAPLRERIVIRCGAPLVSAVDRTSTTMNISY